MAQAPLKGCTYAGCRQLVRDASYCDQHKRADPRSRPGDPFYSSRRWRGLRLRKLAIAPLCEDCLKINKTTAATEVHHVAKRQDHPELAYTLANLESLCKACHSRRTVRGE